MLVTLLDDATCAVWVENLKNSEVSYSNESFVRMIAKKVQNFELNIRSDRAKEYMCEYLGSFYKGKGIDH